METCAGCGAPLAPAWKFCVHCGLAIETPEPPEVPGAIRPPQVTAPDHRRRSRALLIGGIGIFIFGIALMVVAAVFFIGALH